MKRPEANSLLSVSSNCRFPPLSFMQNLLSTGLPHGTAPILPFPPPVSSAQGHVEPEERAALLAGQAEGVRTTALWAQPLQHISAPSGRCLHEGVTGLHTSRWLVLAHPADSAEVCNSCSREKASSWEKNTKGIAKMFSFQLAPSSSRR